MVWSYASSGDSRLPGHAGQACVSPPGALGGSREWPSCSPCLPKNPVGLD